MGNKEKHISTALVVSLSLIAIFLGIIIITGSWLWGSYNAFLVKHTELGTKFSDLKVEYQRRSDLFYNLVQVVSSYKEFEKSTLIDVTKARSMAFNNNIPSGTNPSSAKTMDMQQMNQFDGMLSRLLVLFEKYPELKSIEQYNKLSDEISNTENQIKDARKDYNNYVKEYNLLIKRFPANMIAGMFGYSPEPFFENEAGTEKAPKIDIK